MRFERQLDETELQLVSTYNAQAVEVGGAVDSEVLERAFELLCDAYPVVRARIEYRNGAHMFTARSEYRPTVEYGRGRVGELQEEVNRGIEIAPDVCKLILLEDASRAYVALLQNHAAGDGRAWRTIFGTLWRFYAELLGGSRVADAEVVDLPRSCSDLMAERWKALPREAGGASSGSPRLPRVVNEQQRVKLSNRQTRALVTHARRLNTSVHAVLCAAVLTAMRDHLQVPMSRPLACVSAVDLRDRVTPRVGPTETTNFVTTHLAEVTGGTCDPLGAFAPEISRQLDAAIAGRDLPTANVQKRIQDYKDAGWLCPGINNHGVIAMPEIPHTLEVSDYLVLRPSWLARGRPSHVICTFQGQLSIEALYPGSDFTGDQVADILQRTAAYIAHPA